MENAPAELLINETLALENARLTSENKNLRAELEKVRSSNDQLRLVADFSPVLISYVDQQERYRFMNSLYSTWFGFDPIESIGKTILEVVGPTPYEKVRPQVQQVLKGKLVHFENLVVMKDNSTKVVDLQFVPFQQKSGDLNGFVILGYDITGRKQAEVALREAQQRLEFALTSAQMSSWYLDLKKNQVSTAIGSQPLLGYEIEKVDLADAVKIRVHPDDVDATLKAIRESIQERKLYHHEYRQIQADGTYRWMSSRATPVYDETGKAISMSGVMTDITDTKQKEDLYQAITELTPQFVWMSDESGAIIFSNSTLLTYMGVEQKEVSGDLWLERIHPDDREKTLQTWKNSLSSKTPYEIEFRLRSKGGNYNWFLNRALPMKNNSGLRVDRWLGVSTDITRLKEIEIALTQSEDRFRTLADSIAQFAWSARPDGYRTWYNQRWYDYTGSTPEEVIGSGWMKFQSPDHLDRVVESYNRSIQSGEKWEITLPIRSKSGLWRWFLVLAVPIKNEQGEILRWLGTGTDITEQRKNRDNLALLSETSVILSSSLDYNETLQQLAKVAVPTLADWCSITVIEDGKPRGVAIAHPDPIMKKLGDEFRTKYPTDWNSDVPAAKVLRTGKSELHPWVTDEMVAAVAKDSEHLRILQGLKIRSVMMVPIRGSAEILGLLVLVSSTDDRRYSEADLSIAEEIGRRAGLAIDNARLFTQARTAIQMRDEFLSIASHELKTPITSLALQIQLNQRRLQKEEGYFSDKKIAQNLLDATSKQVHRLSKLVESMLDISRIAHGKLILEPEDVDLGFLVSDVVDRFHEQLSTAGYKYQMNIESKLNGIWDRYRLEQVVTNLITNAMKYGDGKPIEISVFTESKNAVLIVRDHGAGIAPENLARIFDRFERAVTGNGISGLGLGLYISRQIAEAHGGKIIVESEVGNGSSFRVQIPLTR